MTNNELKTSQLLAELILAIQDNSIEKTKDLVAQINELDVLTAEFPYRTFLAPHKITNESAIYAATNLTNVSNKDELLWEYRIRQVSITGDREKIRNFINEYMTVENIGTLKLYQVSGLFGLCIDYQMFDMLDKLRGVFNEANSQSN